MPVTYEILDAPEAVLARYTGVVSLAEITTMFRDYMRDDCFSLSRPHIADIRNFDSKNVFFTEIYVIFSMYGRCYSKTGERMKVAIIAPNEVAFGISRIFENLTEQSDWASAAIFESLDDAKSWIEANTCTAP